VHCVGADRDAQELVDARQLEVGGDDDALFAQGLRQLL
jgi:hypothetical protein